jgi:MoaA/NifB/PqqE/SkfB family radical SAM enzyme
MLAVTFSGGGEPTANAHFDRIVGYARHCGLRVGVYSNGILGSRLVRVAGIADWIYVSLDADNTRDYRGIKGVDAFEQVCQTVRLLTATAKAVPDAEWTLDNNRRSRAIVAKIMTPHRDYAATVGVGFLLTERNWPRAEAMQALAHELGADYSQFRPVAGLDDYGWVPMALAELKRVGALHSRERFTDLYDDWRGVYKRGYAVCRASEIGPCIGSDGELWVCPNTRQLPGRGLGNVVEEGFGPVWERRETQLVGDDCEPTCRHHSLNKTLSMVCQNQPHEEFV